MSLKIGRYKKTEWYETYLKTGVPEVKEPKSELTLDNEELDKLVNYINHHYYPLSNNENKYLTFDNETMSTLIKDNNKKYTHIKAYFIYIHYQK